MHIFLDLPPDTLHFGRWFGSLYRKTQTYMKEAFKHLGLGFSDSIVLILACAHEGISQEEISARLAIDKAVTAKSLKHLEQEGLVRRDTDQADMRVKRVFPTDQGLRLKKRMDLIVLSWNKQLIDSLTEDELTHVFPALRKMSLAAINIPIAEFIREHGFQTSPDDDG